MKKENRIIIIGKGNVASHLSRVLKAKCTKDIFDATATSDIIILAVNDDAIAEVAGKLKNKNKIVVHTSGSVELDVLKECSANYGVLYPLQTISKKRKLNWREVPVCIEGSNKKTERILFHLALRVIKTKQVYKINSDQRRILHLAAVFACNFTNYMYAVAEDILKRKNLSFQLLKPIIQETANKILEISPLDAQTGPAKRNDKKTMREHLKLLPGKNYRTLYKLLSKSIIHNS